MVTVHKGHACLDIQKHVQAYLLQCCWIHFCPKTFWSLPQNHGSFLNDRSSILLLLYTAQGMQYISMLDNLAERHITYTCNIANVYQKNFKNLLSIYVTFVVSNRCTTMYWFGHTFLLSDINTYFLKYKIKLSLGLNITPKDGEAQKFQTFLILALEGGKYNLQTPATYHNVQPIQSAEQEARHILQSCRQWHLPLSSISPKLVF